MKKEIIAFIVLVLVFSASLINVHFLTKLTGGIVTLVEETERFVREEDWASARLSAEKALAKWEERHPYTHAVLRQTELESITSILSDLIKEIYAEDTGSAKGAARAAIARVKSVASVERVTLGNIF